MRAKKAPLRIITPDGKHDSIKIAKLINYIMRSGKKSVATSIAYEALDLASAQTKKKPLELFDEVIAAITPEMEVRSRRVGGAAYQVPMPVRPRRGFALALRWLVEEANKRPNKQYHTFAEKLAAEMVDVLAGQSGSLARKETSHKNAEANKAFSHFRW
ncbi:30S ribosomal protein S7 [Candidatus Saccharibacteria bacterium]|nr:30S ribosomal protein S7 [Candidatus Saccharibacteria bacterium]